MPKCVYVVNVNDNIIDFEELTEMKIKNNFAIGTVKYVENLQFICQVKIIQRLLIDMKIGLFFMHSLSNEDLNFRS